MLQCVAVCYSALQCAVVCCSAVQWGVSVAVCCCVLQCVAVGGNIEVMQGLMETAKLLVCGNVLLCVAVCCSVLQYVAVCAQLWT